jgi:hypothetical protein
VGVLPIFEAMSRSHTLYQVASAMAPTVSIVPNSARCGKLAREGAHVGGGARRLRKRLFGKRNRCKYFRHTHGYVCMSRIHVRGVQRRKKAKLLEFGPNYEHSYVRNRQNVRNYEKAIHLRHKLIK